jgi:ribonuclease-3 family protein
MLTSMGALTIGQANAISPRQLAHLGDAVYHVFIRERQVLTASNAQQMHRRTSVLASASSQSKLLDALSQHLRPAESDLVRRARNLKAPASRASQQSTYRKSTAFEALIGYLYLTDGSRLAEILELIACQPEPGES